MGRAQSVPRWIRSDSGSFDPALGGRRRCRRQDAAANRRDRLGLPQRTNSGCLSPTCDLSFICAQGRRPAASTPTVTAGLKCPPDTEP